MKVNGMSRTGVNSLLVSNGNGIGRNDGDSRPMAKFMLSLRQDSMKVISVEAINRGISVQELLRAVIIPEWVKTNLRES
ncbi:hypothetical protein E6H23_04790 [Candidatus Bathyarchaeota archaeon]|nr:MAG: hypothetical protein E6H23_04790 [Candidatus Bathyarchaeota archaeon]